MVNISASPKLTQQGYKYLFRNFQTTENLAYNGLELMKALFEKTEVFPQTAAILRVNDTYGESMFEALERGLSKFNLPFRVVDSISYDPRTQDLSS